MTGRAGGYICLLVNFYAAVTSVLITAKKCFQSSIGDAFNLRLYPKMKATPDSISFISCVAILVDTLSFEMKAENPLYILIAASAFIPRRHLVSKQLLASLNLHFSMNLAFH